MDKSRKIELMGIINLTPDSFYGGSRVLGPDGLPDTAALLSRIETMAAEGAGIIDIGACSSRPGSVPVGEEVEWERLEPALEVIRGRFPNLRISIDTTFSSIVQKAFDMIGPFTVNDISAGEDDPLMLPTVARLGLGYVAMHHRESADVVSDVISFFREFGGKAADAGLEDWILDPGFGFGKTLDQNYRLLAALPELLPLGRPILVGVSRKSMVWKLLGITPEDALPGTQILHYKALEGGASILRVHDVAEAAHTIKIYRTMITEIT